jgi:hypothetical protein
VRKVLRKYEVPNPQNLHCSPSLPPRPPKPHTIIGSSISTSGIRSSSSRLRSALSTTSGPHLLLNRHIHLSRLSCRLLFSGHTFGCTAPAMNAKSAPPFIIDQLLRLPQNHCLVTLLSSTWRQYSVSCAGSTSWLLRIIKARV